MKYRPAFHQVLVEIDTSEEKWGTGNDDSIMGPSYNKGTAREVGIVFATDKVPMIPQNIADMLSGFEDKVIMWNEGSEAGKTWEEDNKKYAFIDWWQIVGYSDDE